MKKREIAIMNEAFMVGRIYAKMGERESPSEIQRKLEEKCKMKADAEQPETQNNKPHIPMNNEKLEQDQCPLHCWHSTGTVLTCDPPIRVQVCCHCGDERTIRELPMPDIANHGKFHPDKLYYG